MAEFKMSKKSIIGAVVCAVAVITVIASVIGIASSGKVETEQAVSLGVGQVYTYSGEGSVRKAKSDNEGVATVGENGEITAVAAGDCTVKFGSKEIKITVVDAPLGIAFDKKEIMLGVGEELVNPAKAPNIDVVPGDIYSLSVSGVASIDAAGKITALSPGETVITASTYNGLSDECRVVVKKAPEEIKFSAGCEELAVGRKHNLLIEVSKDSYSSVITVKSDNPSVLTVDENGMVTAVAKGEATVTASTFNGKTVSCKIKVVDEVGYIRKNLDPNKPMVAFTFDDGPNASTTNRILTALEENNGAATFFIVGNRTKSKSNQEAIKRMIKNGCQLGNHTYDHEHYGKNVTASDISKCSDALFELTGKRPTAFRPTGGELSDTIKKNANLPIYIWNLDTKDWKTRNAKKTYDTVLKYVEDGDIVLMHDIYKPTAEAVEMLMPELVKRGFQIVNIAELEYYKGVTPENGKVYYSVQ